MLAKDAIRFLDQEIESVWSCLHSISNLLKSISNTSVQDNRRIYALENEVKMLKKQIKEIKDAKTAD